MRCLVTGAAGHLGSHLVGRLVARGEEVCALVRPGGDPWRLAEVADRISLLRADLADLGGTAAAIRSAAPEIVFHLGWQGVAGPARDAPEQISVNVRASLALLDAALAAGCRRWVGVGSQAEYGPHDSAVGENAPARPRTAYGVAKLCVGLLTLKMCELARARAVWVRLFATYGPKDVETNLIPSLVRRLLAGERPALTPGGQRWDYLYVDDAAEALCAAAWAEGAGGVYNLGSGRARTVREIAERVRDLVDPSLPLGLGDLDYAPGQIMHLEADVSRLAAATGWRPAVSLDEGLRHTVEWYKSRARG